jgi:hypothetical protein
MTTGVNQSIDSRAAKPNRWIRPMDVRAPGALVICANSGIGEAQPSSFFAREAHVLWAGRDAEKLKNDLKAYLAETSITPLLFGEFYHLFGVAGLPAAAGFQGFTARPSPSVLFFA